MTSSSLIRVLRVLFFILAVAAIPIEPATAAGKGKGGGGAESGREHPDMHEALDSLRKAKTSAEPLADLNAAYQRLKQGRQNKEGYRVRAMNLTEQAIEKRKAKENVEADKLIDEAISVVEK